MSVEINSLDDIIGPGSERVTPTKENIDATWELLPKYIDEIMWLTENAIPKESKIMCLAFTGSRAFGWGGYHHDVDVRGLISKPVEGEVWFDTMHIGCNTKGYDIRLTTTQHLNEVEVPYKMWTTAEDLSKPFYTDASFDHDAFTAQFDPSFVHMSISEGQMKRYEINEGHMRPALHTYRNLMVPMWFLISGTFEINIMRLNELFFNLIELPNARYCYALRDGCNSPHVSIFQMEAEMKALYETHKVAIENFTANVKDQKEIDERKALIRTTLNAELDELGAKINTE
jgi:predicted nucleotidyltransferase